MLNRIKEASINETMHKIAHDLQRLKTTYQQSLEQQSSLTSTDPLIRNLEIRKYFFIVLEKDMEIMNKMLNSNISSSIISFNSRELNERPTQLSYKELARKIYVEKSYDPPGELSKGGKRHDNDFKEISKISIIPTKEEIFWKNTSVGSISKNLEIIF